jgi:CDP-glucose 4,6-dehydratase
MENLGMIQFQDIYRKKRVLITGHTGFKGSWLTLWLKELGAEISGIALQPYSYLNHWDLLDLSIDDNRLDIRDYNRLLHVFQEKQPEIVFHLAAQPLVRKSYHEPLDTWSTNVIGTANVLEACRHTSSVRAIVVVTTDKCYQNQEWPWGYRENDRLGGHDPYSASKAGAELVASSYRSSYFDGLEIPLLATARAGNVIGGGDWSEDRLIPDLVRSIEKNSTLEIRSPNARRPWQHVLESLSGYLLLGSRLLQGDKIAAQAWNFGPNQDGNRAVTDLLESLSEHWTNFQWIPTDKIQPHETGFLYLDSSSAKHVLGWQPVWDFKTSVSKTADWYNARWQKKELISLSQLVEYISSASQEGSSWIIN